MGGTLSLPSWPSDSYEATRQEILQTYQEGGKPSWGAWRSPGNLNLLHVAADRNDRTLATLLLEQGWVDGNGQGALGETPLHVACVRGAADIVRLLLREQRLHVGMGDAFGATPLWYAAANGHQHVVEMLLREARGGRHVGVRSRSNGRSSPPFATPLDVAASREIADLLIEFLNDFGPAGEMGDDRSGRGRSRPSSPAPAFPLAGPFSPASLSSPSPASPSSPASILSGSPLSLFPWGENQDSPEQSGSFLLLLASCLLLAFLLLASCFFFFLLLLASCFFFFSPFPFSSLPFLSLLLSPFFPYISKFTRKKKKSRNSELLEVRNLAILHQNKRYHLEEHFPVESLKALNQEICELVGVEKISEIRYLDPGTSQFIPLRSIALLNQMREIDTLMVVHRTPDWWDWSQSLSSRYWPFYVLFTFCFVLFFLVSHFSFSFFTYSLSLPNFSDLILFLIIKLKMG